MKKLFIGLFTVMLAVSFIACKPSSGTDDNSTTDQTSSGGDSNSNGGNQNPAPTYIGTKAPTVAKAVGDVVFNDGSAMAYTDFAALDAATKNTKKTSAIALIFYKGTGLNSDVNGVDDTTTSKTLGVGLKHNRRELAWCRWTYNTDYANAYDKNITTIQCPASGNAGSLTFTGDKNGSDNLEQIEAFEGVDDTATVENYPAFYFGKNYKNVTGSNVSGTDYENGWYLPSIAELFQIYACRADSSNGFDIDAASQALGGNKFGTSNYWSSTQYPSNDAYAMACGLSFDDGDWFAHGKDTDWDYVCCIRAFN